jgi:hypothetical protein
MLRNPYYWPLDFSTLFCTAKSAQTQISRHGWQGDSRANPMIKRPSKDK